jgi:hypothetical protein
LRSVDEPGKSAAASTRQGSAAFASGSLILDGRFRVDELLGGGGMGLVYRATQVSLGRTVAVKVLREDLNLQPGMAERFRREALLLSSVEHPAVVRVIEFGLHQNFACLVMEYVEGATLEARLSQGPIPLEQSLRILTQLAQGLAAIHARGIVHRDLKPENVLFSRSTEGVEQARLLDFGIARLADSDSPANNVTVAGMVLGTPEYLSPEQAMGKPPEARSDFYSLGVLAYRMLAGVLPYPGPSAGEFIAQHVQTAPRPLLEVAPGLAGHATLAALVMQCLSKTPEQRVSTASELAAALVHLSTPKVSGGGPVPPMVLKLTQQVRAHRRRRWPFVVGLAGLLAAGVAVGALIFLRAPERRVRKLLDASRGSEALQVIDDAGDLAKTPAMVMLRAAALHQVNRHDEETELFAALAPREGVPLEPQLARGLCDDFGRKEAPSVRKLIAAWPRSSALPVLQVVASGPTDKPQWGALRLTDLEYAGQGLKLVELYGNALESNDCRIRAVAARRLGELHSLEAIPALKKLRDIPRKRGVFTDDECGQDAAASSVKKLEHELNP